jgi:hypothetical protein
MKRKNTSDPTSLAKKAADIRLTVAIIIILILLALLFYQSKASVNRTLAETTGSISWDTNAEEGSLPEINEEEIRKELDEKVQEGMIRISMNTSPVFADGSSKGNLLIVNDVHNNYPQVVFIVLKDTGEEIYRSGAIPVGSKVEQAALDTRLPAGTYECVAYFSNVDVETGAFLGTAGAEITITIQK